MKYKNQLIIGGSILVVILAVFIGTRLIGNVSQEDSTLGNGMINNEISDIADDGIIDDEKVDQDKNIENTNKDSKENTKDEKDTTSKMDEKENTDETNKDVDDKEKTDDTDKELDENKSDETNKKTDDNKELNEEKTSKNVDEDGNIIDETKDSDKELKQSQGKNVVYVFKNKYIVQPKETLSDITKKCLIANKLDVSNNIYFEHAKKLISKVNNIADPNLIITGSKMIIPTKANFENLLPEGEAYTIKTGDTIYDIVVSKMSWCKDYHKAIEMLMKHNNITDENAIKAGITIYIPQQDGEV
ncbi:LysM peptidoglycan-binding domain-containing protein [Oceanirhabdus sp. W0125-5]|uniref:LysM peptidoglycan-binding domain-containing protein n=1 Tax=Oceanirhabdus sp. W0125-5 TaxID=2999116 RepID=UPI0022F33D4B|nr:LysM domain-containing protein [Oceanirhabdus sp. W0125-5]WBW97490.1 LysM domain-containing protein [Oceanirhabdus sp. W0125-5]